MKPNKAPRTLSKVLPLLVLTPACVPVGPEFWQGDEASARVQWTIDGEPASATTCGASDGSTVHLSVSRTAGVHEWWPSELPSWSCAAGEGETGLRFAAGTYILALQLRDDDGAAVATQEIGSVTLVPGTNDLGTAAFSTVEPGDVILRWEWTIEGHDPSTIDYGILCAWAGYGSATVRLLVDTDLDGTEDYYYPADCDWQVAETDPGLDPAEYVDGQEIRFAARLLDTGGTTISTSGELAPFTLHEGTNDLGAVDFDIGDFGPLDVTLEWASDTGSTTFGDCASPPDDVAVMGYLLRHGSGEVTDQVDIDPGMGCTTHLGWLETAFGVYELVVDAESGAGTHAWGSTCTGLEVDDEIENGWSCEVHMTSWP